LLLKNGFLASLIAVPIAPCAFNKAEAIFVIVGDVFIGLFGLV
jgi:hypothetical protein